MEVVKKQITELTMSYLNELEKIEQNYDFKISRCTERIDDLEKAVETMDNVKTIIKTQSEHVEQTAGAFAHINDGVQSSIKGINAISSKAEQLDYARANVVDLVQNLTAIAQENAASSQETSASVTEISSIVDNISDRTTNLKDIAEELEERMSIFKI